MSLGLADDALGAPQRPSSSAPTATAGILDRLSEGIATLTTSDKWTKWLDVQRKFHNYSWGNTMLIMFQRPDSTNVAGYRAWQSMGRQVRKGEKGIVILAPIVRTREDPDSELGEKQRAVVAFRHTHVFDIAQTDGDPLPQVATRLVGEDPHDAYNRLSSFAGGIGYSVQRDRLEGEKNGDCTYDIHRIRVRDGLSPAASVKTLAHELAHAILHAPNVRPPDATAELVELEAESVAYVVCSGLDIDSGAYSFGYVAGWSGGGDEAIAAIKKSAQRIQQTARFILDGL